MGRRVVGLVIAAGSSRRLGRPKQLLPYQGSTLLDASLDVARAAPFDHRIVTVGGAADAVREGVDLSGFEVVDSVRHSEGCSSSIVTALEAIDSEAEGVVLLLGDQPGVSPATITDVIATGAEGADIVVCAYDDGIGHPFWFGSRLFPDLTRLHGDKAVWKLIESGRFDVRELSVPGPIPLDVDTWDDYERLLASDTAE